MHITHRFPLITGFLWRDGNSKKRKGRGGGEVHHPHLFLNPDVEGLVVDPLLSLAKVSLFLPFFLPGNERTSSLRKVTRKWRKGYDEEHKREQGKKNWGLGKG